MLRILPQVTTGIPFRQIMPNGNPDGSFLSFLICGKLFSIIASFSSPEQIGTKPAIEFWLLPLAAAVAVVYKATKLKTITPANFIKEAFFLFGSIVVFIFVAVLVLFFVNRLILS